MTQEGPRNGFRTFLIIWVTQSLSVFGTSLTFFALTIWLTQVRYPNPEQQPQLAFALSAVGLAAGLPALFVAPLAGAWADRHDRKRTMLIADLLNMVLSLVLVVAVTTGKLELWSLLVAIVLFGVLQSFHSAAFDTSYAMLVPERLLPRANGMMQTIWSLAGILSPGIAAALIALPALARQGIVTGGIGGFLSQVQDGTPIVLALDGCTFLVAALVLPFLHVPSPVRHDLAGEGGRMRKSVWADIREGASYIWRRRPLLWLLGTFAIVNFAVTPSMVMAPMLVKFNLASDLAARGFAFEPGLALLSSVASMGGVVGGFLITAWGGLKRRRIFGLLVPMLLVGGVQIAYGLSPWLYLTAGMAGLMNGMTPIMNAHSQTIWQTQTPRELQGRVFSVRRVIAQCTAPLSTVIAGVVGGLINPGFLIAGLGTFMLLFMIGQLFNPHLMKVEDKALLDQMAAN